MEFIIPALSIDERQPTFPREHYSAFKQEFDYSRFGGNVRRSRNMAASTLAASNDLCVFVQSTGINYKKGASRYEMEIRR